MHLEMRPHSGGRRPVLFSPLWEPYEFIWIINALAGSSGGVDEQHKSESVRTYIHTYVRTYIIAILSNLAMTWRPAR